MTKAQLLNAVSAKEGFDAFIGEPIVESENDARDRRYRVNVRSVRGDTVSYENLYFVLIDEGSEKERAYYLEEPASVSP